MPTLLDLDELPADVRSELQASADDHGRSVQEEAFSRLLDSGALALQRLRPAEPMPPVDWPADAPNEEDTRMVDEILQPALEELRGRRPTTPVQVIRAGKYKYQPCCESEEEAPE
jgi:hypothetical protein